MTKRVLHFQGRMGLGGAESFMMNIYRKLDKSKLQFDFLIYDDYADIQDYHTEVHSMGGRIFVVTNPKKNIIKYIYEVGRLLKKYEFDIAHNEVYFGGGINLWLARLCGIKKRISHSHATEDGKGNGLLLKIVRKLLRVLLLCNATELVAVSREAGESLYGKREFTIVHNGIDLSMYNNQGDYNAKKKELGIPLDAFVIGNIGRLEKQKNQTLLIDIFSKIKSINVNSKLIIVGEGSLKSDLEKKVKQNGLDSDIFFLGERRDIPEIINLFDVFAMTSLYEGLPMVCIEAQASLKKLVLSNTISSDTKLTPNVIFVPLDAPIEDWANEILKEPFGNSITDKLLSYDSNYTLEQILKIYGI